VPITQTVRKLPWTGNSKIRCKFTIGVNNSI